MAHLKTLQLAGAVIIAAGLPVLAARAQVQTPRGRSVGLVVEADDLDALAAGEHNLANGVIFRIVVHGGVPQMAR